MAPSQWGVVSKLHLRAAPSPNGKTMVGQAPEYGAEAHGASRWPVEPVARQAGSASRPAGYAETLTLVFGL